MKFLVIETCSERHCSVINKPYFLDLPSLQEAREKVLSMGCDYYPYDENYDYRRIAKEKQGHEFTICEIAAEHPARLQEYLRECVAKQQITEDRIKEEQERAQLAESLNKYPVSSTPTV